MTVDKSGANLAALHAVNAQRETPIKIRQRQYLNNRIEQDLLRFVNSASGDHKIC
nr:hypothetical protein [Burkholderia sp. TSV86]